MDLICTYLKTKNFETLAQLLWENVCLILLPILKFDYNFLLLLSARSSLCILVTSLYEIYDLQTHSPTVLVVL